MAVRVSAPVGNGTVLASYGAARTNDAVQSDRDIASLGYDHFLSKRTDLYAVYMHDKVENLNSGDTFAVGIRHRF